VAGRLQRLVRRRAKRLEGVGAIGFAEIHQLEAKPFGPIEEDGVVVAFILGIRSRAIRDAYGMRGCPRREGVDLLGGARSKGEMLEGAGRRTTSDRIEEEPSASPLPASHRLVCGLLFQSQESDEKRVEECLGRTGIVQPDTEVMKDRVDQLEPRRLMDLALSCEPADRSRAALVRRRPSLDDRSAPDLGLLLHKVLERSNGGETMGPLTMPAERPAFKGTVCRDDGETAG